MNAQNNFLVEHILWSMFTRLLTFSMDKKISQMEESFDFLEEKLPDGTQEKNREGRMIL